METSTAKQQFDEFGGAEEPDPLERLRFFCSIVMRGQDWLDVEPFFDDVRKAMTPNKQGEALAAPKGENRE